MSNYNSQEQTIYRSLAGKIQLGFYDKDERFPSVKEIARRYQVSYCPAQRALKMLEQDGLIKLCRGKATVILAKPFEDYLGSPVFPQRAEALLDLCKCLKLISPAVSFHNIQGMTDAASLLPEEDLAACTAQKLFSLFEQSLHVMGSHSVLSLYYDISSFAESAFPDIFSSCCTKEETAQLWQELTDSYNDCWKHCGDYGREECLRRLDQLSSRFYDTIISYLADFPCLPPENSRIPFVWEPRKGRTRYCDAVAIDVICKINQDAYPVGTLLPKGAVLADIYHVSEITIRRTIRLLNRLGVTQTFNGVGTRVIKKGDSSIPHKLRELTLDDNMRCFLEALQLLAVLAEPVIRHTFPHIPADALHTLYEAAGGKDEKKAMVQTVGLILQAVVHYSPLLSLREIYSKLTHLLLFGSILRLEETGEEAVPGWPEIAASVREGCLSPGSGTLAQACRALFENNFASTKQTLMEIGVKGAEEITGFETNAPSVTTGNQGGTYGSDR